VATPLRLKHLRSSITGTAPTAAQIEAGQIAINYADERIFILNSAGEVVEVASSNTVVLAASSVQSVNDQLPDANGKVEVPPTAIGTYGVPSLDIDGKIPESFLPDSVVGSLKYKGAWDAATNTPPLPDPTTSEGFYYIVEVSGTHEGIEYTVGDWVISNGTDWQKIDAHNDVTSVAGKTGAVTLAAGDISSGVFTSNRLGTSPANNSVLTTSASGNPTWVPRAEISGVTSVALTAPSNLLTVAGSPITSSGTLQLGLANQATNVVFAGPSTGAAGAPTFRSMVAADIPALDTSKISTGVFNPDRLGAGAGNNLVLTTDASGNPNWVSKSAVGDGTVKSVAMSVPSTLLAVSGSPITTSGTLAVTLPARAANLVFAGPVSGASATPAFRALAIEDLPTLDEGTF